MQVEEGNYNKIWEVIKLIERLLGIIIMILNLQIDHILKEPE